MNVLDILRDWPSLVELREDDGKRELVFIFERKNSRALNADQIKLIHLLQEFGHKAYIRIAGIADVTLEQFERSGVYGVKISQTIQNRQGLYNKTSELKKLELELPTISLDSPRRFLIAQRIEHLRAMMGTVDLSQPSEKALRESDQRLIAAEQALRDEREYNDVELLNADWPEIAKISQPRRDEVWKRKVKLHKGGQNDQSEPTVKGEDSVTAKDNVGRVGLNPVDDSGKNG